MLPVHGQVWLWRTFAGTPGVSGSADSPSLQARFYQPHGIVIDPEGNAFVADLSNHTIRKITPQGVVTTVAGTNSAGFADGTGSSARFSSPAGITRDSFGNLYVADGANNRIRKITPAGVVSTVAGQTLAGTADGVGSAAQFNVPRGIAIDTAGNLHVTDTGNHTIRKITPAGVVTTLAGAAGTAGTANGSGAVARFNRPEGIAIDLDGNFLITELISHTIRKVTPAGNVTLVAGQPGVSGASSGPALSASFYSPTGIAVASDGSIYISDCNNNNIRQLTPAGMVNNLAGLSGSEGSQDGQGSAARFNNPYGIAINPDGSLLVTDRDNSALRRIIPFGIVSLYAGQPNADAYQDSPSSPAQFFRPMGLAFDPAGNLYVSDGHNYTIRKINPAGAVSTLAGLAGWSGATDGTGSASRFFRPYRMTADTSGNLYVADTGAHTIRKITQAGAVTTVAGLALSSGSSDGTGDAARFSYPTGVAWIPANGGTLLVSDGSNKAIRSIHLATRLVTTVAGPLGDSYYPEDLCATPSGDLFLADSTASLVRRLAAPVYGMTTVGGALGQASHQDGPFPDSRFFRPCGIHTDGFWTLVSDYQTHTIRRMSASSPYQVVTIGGVVNSSGMKDGIGAAARFFQPLDVTMAPNGDIYVADTENHRIVHGRAYANPWVAWQAQYLISGGATGDDDRDGVANLLEFAFGTDPRNGNRSKMEWSGNTLSSNGLPSVGPRFLGGLAARFIMRQDRHGLLTYDPQFSSDLNDWFSHTGFVSAVAANAETALFEIPFPATLPNGKVPRFFRVVVTLP